MAVRLFAVPAVALLTLSLVPLPPADRPAVPPSVAPTAGETPTQSQWESLLMSDPVAALRASRARYAAEVAGFRAVRDRLDAVTAGTGRVIDLEVDGGIDPETARQVIAAGADVLVAGTATFAGGPPAYAANIRRLRGGDATPPGR